MLRMPCLLRALLGQDRLEALLGGARCACTVAPMGQVVRLQRIGVDPGEPEEGGRRSTWLVG
jgi:hypothetical protein